MTLGETPRGRLFLEYVAKLADELLRVRAKSSQEVAAIQGQADHIKAIVAAQQKASKLATSTERVPVNEIVAMALSLSRGSLIRGRCTIEENLSDDVPTFDVDKHRIIQILMNLLSNAPHATAAKFDSPTITVSTEWRSDRFAVTVADNGSGHRARTDGVRLQLRLHHQAERARVWPALEHQRGARGDLRAQSQGANCGARFTLELAPIGGLTSPA